MPHLSDLNIIRVIIKYAPNFGHQVAAITGMKKLRALGFKGRFDIRYEESFYYLIQMKQQPEKLSHHILLGYKLANLINGYVPPSISSDIYEIDRGSSFDAEKLGAIDITRLPFLSTTQQAYLLPEVQFTFCFGDDEIPCDKTILLKRYCTQHYIGLQPTDWPQSRFVVSEHQVIDMPSDLKLCADDHNYLTYLSEVEKKIINICHNNCNTQLVYAITESEDSEVLGGELAFKRLIAAHRLLIATENIPTVLFFTNAYPQISGENIYHVNLEHLEISFEAYENNAIICVYTGQIRMELFNKLMATLATYPPIIEGCNSINYCESLGLPYIVGGRIIPTNPILYYNIPYNLNDKLEQHKSASFCLSYKDAEDKIDHLAGYMQDSKALKNLAYHNTRKNIHNARADGVKTSLDLLGYHYAEDKTVLDAYEKSKNKNQIQILPNASTHLLNSCTIS